MRGCYCDGSSVRFREDLPGPVRLEGEEPLHVHLAGICDTDIQLARGYMGFRGILGHEFVGTTDSGRRVVAEINNACRTCPTCLNGSVHHCPHRSVLGILNHDGAMADIVMVPSVNLHEIPASIDDRQAVFIEPLAAAFRIAEQVPTSRGDRVAVLGDGKLGLLCAWVLRLTGASIHLVGKHPMKLAMAGAAIEPILLDQCMSDAKSFDVVVDATGSPTGFSTALGLVKPQGTVVLKTTVAGDYFTNLAPVVIDELKVIGSRCGPFPKAIEALVNRQVDVLPLIEAEYPLEEAEEAFRRASTRGARKVLLRIR